MWKKIHSITLTIRRTRTSFSITVRVTVKK